MRTVKRLHPMRTILALCAVVIGIAMASIGPAPSNDGENGCSRGDRNPVCHETPPP